MLLIEADDRNIILDDVIKLSCFIRRQVNTSMGSSAEIPVSAKIWLPICIVESNSSVKRHPVSYRLLIGIGSVLFLTATKYIRALLIIKCKDSRRSLTFRITWKSGYDIRFKDYIAILIVITNR